jgi:transcriptional regulator with XRE-family HTH domain
MELNSELQADMPSVLMGEMTFAEKLKDLMERHRLSQEDLAEMVGTYQSQISRWFNDGLRPSVPFALRVARAFRVPLEYLIDDEMEEPPGPTITQHEWDVIDLMRGFKLDRATAMRGLAIVAERQPPNPAETERAKPPPPAPPPPERLDAPVHTRDRQPARKPTKRGKAG